LFRGYIDMEIQLREFTRCRTLYEKFLEFNPENVQTWMKFAELENLLGDVERARALYELAIGQPRLDMPEILWKAYIDFEIEQEETDRARDLYKRLLTRTQHVKVWLSFAQFELQVDHEDRLEEARHVYEDANKKLRQNGEKEERLMLLEAWKQFEKELYQESEDETSLRAVEKLMPRRVKKRRKIQSEDGTDQGWEEFFEYIFPRTRLTNPTSNFWPWLKCGRRIRMLHKMRYPQRNQVDLMIPPTQSTQLWIIIQGQITTLVMIILILRILMQMIKIL